MGALVLCISVIVGCRERTVPALNERPRAVAPAASQRVALRPPADARELAEGVFAIQLRAANEGGAAIESMPEMFLIETTYDRSGQEFATSIPSMRWSDLTQDARAGLAGMRAGEQRRIWRCKEGETAPCTVEDVQVLQREAARRPPKP